jgi:diguanylate cyclase (GGDEF)-like protein/PAS domain S-box-containing protein
MLRNSKMCFGVVEQAADSIFVMDNAKRVIYQNPEARKVFGYDNDEILGHCIFEKIRHDNPDANEFFDEESYVDRTVAYGETKRDFIWRVYRKDGSCFYASCTSSPLVIDGEQVGAIFFATDITARKTAEEILRSTAEKLQLAIEVAEVGLYDYSLTTNELVWTDTLKKQFGLPLNAPVTREMFFAGIHPDDRERIRTTIEEMSDPESGGHYQYEYRAIGLLDRQERWLVSRGQFFYEEGKPVRQIGATVDITERKKAEEALRQAGHHCPLTGLPNRALLAEFTEHLFAMAERDGADSAVLFVDLDRFKPINDLYGHEVGDKVLLEVARRLRVCTRKEDIVSRLGGDEFIVMLPHVDTSSDPQTVAQHIIDRIAQPFQIGTLQLHISASVGISLFPKHGKELEALIRCADLAMYAAKRSGRNTYKVYIPGDEERSSAQLQLEVHLKHALESNGMTLFYQPIMDINTGQLVGVEALIRLVGVQGNLLTPDQFIPIAEAAGLIDKLGHWVAHEACRQHQAWRASGLPPFPIAINVSALEFRQRAFPAHLAQAIEASGIDPSCLQIELTESAVMENITEAVATLNEIRAMGIRISLDDFGTGYSSLSYLSTLPLDKLKIDQSFIRKLDTSHSSQAITDTIIGLGRIMNLQVVGEGIESVPAMEYLRAHGCNQAQGFLYSKPLPANEFESWYRSRTNSLH